MCLLSSAKIGSEKHVAFGEYASFRSNKKYEAIADELRRTSGPFTWKAYWSVIKGAKSLGQWRDLASRRDLEDAEIKLCTNLDEIGCLLFLAFLASGLVD